MKKSSNKLLLVRLLRPVKFFCDFAHGLSSYLDTLSSPCLSLETNFTGLGTPLLFK